MNCQNFFMILTVLVCLTQSPHVFARVISSSYDRKFGQFLNRADENSARSVVVAVIDTGADLRHPALSNHLWTNPKEIPDNQIDDDKNGLVDDVNGWNFANNNSDLSDLDGHGTHISGLILRGECSDCGLQSKNGVRLMILKYYRAEATPAQTLSHSLQALKYAIEQGAQVINYSGGGPTASRDELRLLRKAQEKGIAVVAAAGNEGHNIDEKGFFPAAYRLENILAVGAHDREGRRAQFSNYGARRVQAFAPGVDVTSTLPNGRYGVMSGTSQATALVTHEIVTRMSRGQKTGLQEARN